MMLAVVIGMIAGLGVTLIVRELVPSTTRLSDAITNLAPRDPSVEAPTAAPVTTPKERVGEWVSRRSGHLPGGSAPEADLALIGMTTRQFYADKAISAGIGFLAPVLFAVISAVLDLGLPLVVPGILSLLFGGMFWFLPDASVAARAKQARRAHAYAVAAYARLVAIRRLGSYMVVASMEQAAKASESLMFVQIDRSLAFARAAGIPQWTVLADLGKRLRLPELGEVAHIMQSAGEGAAVTTSLMERARSINNRLLVAEATAAAKADSELQVPQAFMVSLIVIMGILPAAAAMLG